VVDAIASLIHDDCPGAHIFSSGALAVLMQPDYKFSLKAVGALLPPEVNVFGGAIRRVVFPGVLRNLWFAIVCDFSLQLVFAVDFHGREHAAAARAVVRYMHELRVARGGAPISFAEWRCAPLVKLAQVARPSCDSGLFLLLAVWCLAHGAPLDAIRAKDMALWRPLMVVWVVQGALPSSILHA
jgi:hypothetical protein